MGLQEFILFQILRVPVDLVSEIITHFKGPVVIYSSSNLASLATVEWVWSGSGIFPPKLRSRSWITSHPRFSCACVLEFVTARVRDDFPLLCTHCEDRVQLQLLS